MTTKTYKALNPREYSDEKTRATIRRDTVERLCRDYTAAVEVYKRRMTPYRYEPHHAQQQATIDDHTDETDDPGLPVDPEGFADKISGLSSVTASIMFPQGDSDGHQSISVSTSLASYELRIDTGVVRFEL